MAKTLSLRISSEGVRRVKDASRKEGMANHNDLVPPSFGEWDGLQWTANFDSIPGLPGMQPPPHFTSRISLDPKFNSAVLAYAKEWGIRSLDLNVIVFDKY